MFVTTITHRIATNGSIVTRWISIERRELNDSKDGLGLALVQVCLQRFASKVILIVYNIRNMCMRATKTIQFDYIQYKLLLPIFILIEQQSIHSASSHLLVTTIQLFFLCLQSFASTHIPKQAYLVIIHVKVIAIDSQAQWYMI